MYYHGIKLADISSLQHAILSNTGESVAIVSREYGWLLASLAYKPLLLNFLQYEVSVELVFKKRPRFLLQNLQPL